MLRSALLAALVVGTVSCSGSSSTAPSSSAPTTGGSATALSVDVTMPSVVFTPKNIDIAQGGVIRFIFAALEHDVRFGGVAGAPADILTTSNTTVTRTFATKGTYNFVCTLHANMTGVVVVH
jgi:plastocyanin